MAHAARSRPDASAERMRALHALLDAFGVAGHEQAVQRLWRCQVEELADELHEDALGNVVATVGAGAPLRVMLAGHADEIGFVVRAIGDDGFLSIAGIDIEPIVAIGQRVWVQTDEGPLPGVIGRRPMHLRRYDEGSLDLAQRDFWVDVGAQDRAEAEAAVAIGDPVTMEGRPQALLGDLWASRAFDDRLALHVMAEVLRGVAAQRERLTVALHCVSTVQEEVDARGVGVAAEQIAPHVAIVLDVTHATDTPQTQAFRDRFGHLALGGGPVITHGPNNSPALVARLRDVAAAQSIAVQHEAVAGATATDAAVLQLVRGGVATALVGIPLRYMHSPVEVASMSDVEQTIELLTSFVLSLPETLGELSGGKQTVATNTMHTADARDTGSGTTS